MEGVKFHYCAKCGKKITTLHIVIPTTGLRYHRQCKPLDEPVEILTQFNGQEYH